MAEEENEAPETAPENAAEPAESSSEIGTNRFLVKERYEIDYAQPLPWLDSNGAKAFRVIDRIDTKRGLFALLCSNATCPRSTILPYVKSIECRSLMKLVEFGIVTWLPEKSRNLALIYKIPYGKVFEGGKTELDIRSSEKFKNTLISLLSAVEALKNYNITHRAIRADNLYYANAEKTEILIGDCAASFPAFYQPAAYETIEDMLSIPEGRGNGSEKNDIYAIGAVMTALYLGHELGGDISTPELLRIKQKKGSYQALLGDDKIPNQISPVLRSLLNDNVDARLNYVQAYNLLDGKSNNYTSSGTTDRPKRTISFNGENSTRPAILPSPSVRRRRKHTNSYARGNCSTGLKTALKTKNWPAKSKKCSRLRRKARPALTSSLPKSASCWRRSCLSVSATCAFFPTAPRKPFSMPCAKAPTPKFFTNCFLPN